MRFILSILSLFLCFSSCENDKTPETVDYDNIDPIDAARPNGVVLPSQELSAEDKIKLAMAKGRTASHISIDSLVSKINDSSEKLFIYHFWKMKTPHCLEMNKRLSNLSHEISTKKLYIELINLDDTTQSNQLNTYIREENITLNTFQVDTQAENFSLIEKAFNLRWNGEVPALFLINHSNGTNLHYQKAFEYDELYAIIQSLTI